MSYTDVSNINKFEFEFYLTIFDSPITFIKYIEFSKLDVDKETFDQNIHIYSKHLVFITIYEEDIDIHTANNKTPYSPCNKVLQILKKDIMKGLIMKEVIRNKQKCLK